MDIAIKYERINLGYDKFVFKPISIIKGEYDAELDMFETEYGDACLPLESNLSYHEDGFFGSLTSMKKLKEKYQGLQEEDILIEYYNDNILYYHLGYFNHEEDRIELIIIDSEEIESVLQGESLGQEQEQELQVSFNLDEIKELRSITDIKQIHNKLDGLIRYMGSIGDIDYSSDEVYSNESKTQNNSQTSLSLQKEKSASITLKELRKEVKDVIKGQDKAVDAVTRGIIVNQMSKNPKHKSHMLITGPSGTGKTEMINIISRKMGIPYFKADATAYTKEGYVGKSVQSLLNGLINAADGDIEAAQKGILIIDEIDKKLSSKSDDVSGVDVLNSMLKMMDRDVIEIERGKGYNERPILFDTSNLTMIFMGAFADLYSSKENSKKNSIGFGETHEEQTKKKIVITNNDLIKAGMPPEFLGRIPIVTSTEELELEDLVEILYKSKGGVIEEEQEFFDSLGITINFTGPYLREIAKKAKETKTGARNLRKLVRESLSDAYDELVSNNNIKVLKLSKETANNSKKYYTE